MKIKKLMAIMVACVMVLGMSACSSETDDTAPEVMASGAQATEANLGGDSNDDNSQQAASLNEYGFTYNGYTGSAGLPADAVIAGYGDGYSYFESPSCAFQGMDKVYTYSSFLVRTYTRDDVDYVLSIELLDDTVTTPEGIYIGNTADQVRSSYGEPDNETAAGIEYIQGNSTLSFALNGGVVVGISYNALTE